jgi:hypothetical protein
MESDSKKRKKIKANQIKTEGILTTNLPPILEDEGSFLHNIKTDWKLFWHALVGEEENDHQDPFMSGKVELLTLEQIKKITRTLSADRKKINQKIEEVNREIEASTEKLESLRLVGGDLNPTVDQINKLHDMGQQLSHQLDQLNARIKQFRIREDFLKAEKSEDKDHKKSDS